MSPAVLGSTAILLCWLPPQIYRALLALKYLLLSKLSLGLVVCISLLEVCIALVCFVCKPQSACKKVFL